ncbi:hypothetical protein C2845_PM03G33840 [Panicum miliaceum]|uniref:Uncharacterized protein n=1 Tax=Panicum miliaceum TaxID=4540 RepID=A0A3L6THG8_PANMI|nr:hypothetical protein C2845_PM03G33840 [Panicum miliaceum]
MDGVGARRRDLLIFYSEFEYRKHRTIKRDAKDVLEMLECSVEKPKIFERPNLQLRNLKPAKSAWSEVQTWGRKSPQTSDQGSSAKY